MLNSGCRNLKAIFLKKVLFSVAALFSVLLYGYQFEFLAFLTFGDKEVIVLLIGPFLKQNLLWHARNFWLLQKSIFCNRKHIYLILLRNT